MNSNYNFDPNSVIGEDEQFEELDAFLMDLKEFLEKPNVQVLNPTRLKEFQYTYKIITKIVRSVSPDANIKYGMSELGFGSAYIEIEADELAVTDIKEFIGAIKLANNFEVHPLLNGNIKMSIGFQNLLV